jgi:hypothetical protein
MAKGWETFCVLNLGTIEALLEAWPMVNTRFAPQLSINKMEQTKLTLMS